MYFRTLVAAILLITASISYAVGQSGAVAMPPADALANLASGEPQRLNAAGVVIEAAFGPNYGAYNGSQRQELLDGLETTAQGRSSIGDVQRRRSMRRSFAILQSIATDSFTVAEDQQIPALVVRIFNDADATEAKHLAVMLIGELLPRYPAASSMLERMLEEVASAPPGPNSVAADAAIDALLNAGESGKPALQRLHEQRAVKDEAARVYLREIAQRGYTRGR